jgi:hypothetical protein
MIAFKVSTTDAAQKLLQRHFSLADYHHDHPKKSDRIIGKFERAAVASARAAGADGILCGHIHEARLKNLGKVLYGNSGDWIESFTALACNADGEWSVLRWAKMRRNAGLGAVPDESHPHPASAYRPTTLRQVRLIRRLWPARDWAAHLARYAGQYPRIP